ncbi:MAG: YeeE/YedE family protein [Gammaproteobacteria bacterium]|nr:MAG: YeeE/YedE family protein [Gammaproteobacteria bacterium]
MKQALAAFFLGLLFALGLGIAGMTQPAKIIAFLDVTGDWDPSLLLVMASATLVYFLSYRWITRRRAPILAEKFALPAAKHIDARLLAGSMLFGIGWGLSGYCPGPALVALSGLAPNTVVFAVSMLAGMLLFKWNDAWLTARRLEKL